MLDVLVLMAVCDGELADEEREFLASTAGRLQVPLDLDKVEKRTRDYRVAAKQGITVRVSSSARDKATLAEGKARSVLGKVFRHKSAYKRDSMVEP